MTSSVNPVVPAWPPRSAVRTPSETASSVASQIEVAKRQVGTDGRTVEQAERQEFRVRHVGESRDGGGEERVTWYY